MKKEKEIDRFDEDNIWNFVIEYEVSNPMPKNKTSEYQWWIKAIKSYAKFVLEEKK